MIGIKETQNFRAIRLRFDKQSTDCHQSFMKEHSLRKDHPNYPRGLTLFLINVPPYATTEGIKAAFTDACGHVDSVTLEKSSSSSSSNGFKVAYIVFQSKKGFNKALSLSLDHVLNLSTKSVPCLTGITKYCKQLNESIEDEESVKKQIEEYMQEYDAKVAERMEQDKAAEEEDEEGWVTVTGKKKRGQHGVSRKESTINKIKTNEEKKKHRKQLRNFYTFQIREAKKQELAELRKKYELDKQKIENLKVKRIFKPF